MKITIDTDDMIAAGFTSDDVLKLMNFVHNERKLNVREQNRIRKQNQRSRHAVTHVTRDIKSSNEINGHVTHVTRDKSPHTPPTLNQRIDQSLISREWRPNSDGLLLADQKGLGGQELEEEIERFIDHYTASGAPRSDWQACWRNWVRSPYRNRKGTSHAEDPAAPRTWRDQQYARHLAVLDAMSNYREGGGGEPDGDNVAVFQTAGRR